MKRWNFDPYHQRIGDAMRKAEEPHNEEDTQWEEWEVFVQAERGDNHEWVGAVHAPDPEMALILAKENFIRRQPCANIWIVNTKHVHATSYEDSAMFVPAFDRKYRLAAGFKVNRPASIEEEN